MRAFFAAVATTIVISVTLAGAGMGLPACDSSTSGACAVDYDCAGAQVCKLSSKTCVDFVCKVDSDCQTGLSCDDNECR